MKHVGTTIKTPRNIVKYQLARCYPDEIPMATLEDLEKIDNRILIRTTKGC